MEEEQWIMVYRVNKSDKSKIFHSTAAATPGTARTITANYRRNAVN